MKAHGRVEILTYKLVLCQNSLVSLRNRRFHNGRCIELNSDTNVDMNCFVIAFLPDDIGQRTELPMSVILRLPPYNVFV